MVQFGWVLSLYQRGMVSMGRVAEVLREVPTIRDTENTRHEVTKLQGAIRFENVCFGYEDATVLDHVDFEIPRGSTTAIVGPTGCGKSSVVSLLVREYDPTSGRVCVDDIDIRELPVQLLRSGIGCVPQDTFLFSDTIRANLTFGRPEATDQELDAVSDLAQFTEVVQALDDGYETLLGERGVNLSGGQKQRLAIARAVLRDPQVLVLDDALSSVDTHTEEQILQHLKRVMAERTCVLISHRISTVKHADQILVLDEGRIVARGTHQELLERSGIYARMYERQLLEDAIEKE